jgi:hypothetical protein
MFLFGIDYERKKIDYISQNCSKQEERTAENFNKKENWERRSDRRDKGGKGFQTKNQTTTQLSINWITAKRVQVISFYSHGYLRKYSHISSKSE